MLVPDTDALKPIFSDEEVQAAMNIESTSGLYISSMFDQSGTPQATTLNITSTLRSAAILLDILAGSSSRLAAVIELLDVKLSAKDAAANLRAQAKAWRDTEANQGHFAIIEQVTNQFQARERTIAQWLRIEGGN